MILPRCCTMNERQLSTKWRWHLISEIWGNMKNMEKFANNLRCAHEKCLHCTQYKKTFPSISENICAAFWVYWTRAFHSALLVFIFLQNHSFSSLQRSEWRKKSFLFGSTNSPVENPDNIQWRCKKVPVHKSTVCFLFAVLGWVFYM